MHLWSVESLCDRLKICEIRTSSPMVAYDRFPLVVEPCSVGHCKLMLNPSELLSIKKEWRLTASLKCSAENSVKLALTRASSEKASWPENVQIIIVVTDKLRVFVLALLLFFLLQQIHRCRCLGVKNPLFTVFNRSALFALNLSSSGRTSLFTRTLRLVYLL